MSHLRAERFAFTLPRETAIVTCQRVVDGAPVQLVARDTEGDWQFLCGGDHGDDDAGGDSALLHCLECTVARDPSLNEVADLCPGEIATRETVGAAWTREDHSGDELQAIIDEYGWSVQHVEAGESPDEPAFSYTIGLWKGFEHPDLIVVGLPQEIAHGVLNQVGERIRGGEQVSLDEDLDWIGPYPIRFRQVMTRASYQEYVGRGLDYYEGQPFPLLQLLWTDKERRFPGDPGTTESFNRAQPILP